MTGGHYIGTVKNDRTGEWLQYDDSRCSTLLEDQVQTKAAYILFYRRKDLIGKPMSDIIPKLNVSKFPGMPVKLKRGGKVGYLIEYREGHPCPYKVGLGANTVLYLSEDSVEADPDSEDLSAINNMCKKKWKDAPPEDFTAQGGKEKEKAQTTGKGAKKKKPAVSDDGICGIF